MHRYDQVGWTLVAEAIDRFLDTMSKFNCLVLNGVVELEGNCQVNTLLNQLYT